MNKLRAVTYVVVEFRPSIVSIRSCSSTTNSSYCFSNKIFSCASIIGSGSLNSCKDDVGG